jgi:hypothetical protein
MFDSTFLALSYIDGFCQLQVSPFRGEKYVQELANSLYRYGSHTM